MKDGRSKVTTWCEDVLFSYIGFIKWYVFRLSRHNLCYGLDEAYVQQSTITDEEDEVADIKLRHTPLHVSIVHIPIYLFNILRPDYNIVVILAFSTQQVIIN